MTNNVQKFTLDKVNSFSLSQIILPTQTSNLFPFSVALSANELSIAENCLCSPSVSGSSEQISCNNSL